MNAILNEGARCDASKAKAPRRYWRAFDPFETEMRLMAQNEDAGNWHLIHDALYRSGRWIVDQAIKRQDGAALRYLAALRDRLIAAREYERIHGEQSLRKMDHSQNILLADIKRRLMENNPEIFNIEIPINEKNSMPDWEVYDFSNGGIK